MKKAKKTFSTTNNVLEDALYKKALGYDSIETVEEYLVDEDNNERLTKRKVSKKHIPPDISAAKTLLEYFTESDDFANMTDEELEAEKLELLKYLAEVELNEKKEQEE